MRRTFLSLGSNLGDRRAYLRDAIDSLPGVVAVSPVYETEPWGNGDQGPFLNLVVELQTDLEPFALLGLCHRIESAANRTRDVHWGPRTLDIDIIWMEGVEMHEERLTIPHPHYLHRKFVLAPLRDLAPELVTAQQVEQADGRVTPALGLEHQAH